MATKPPAKLHVFGGKRKAFPVGKSKNKKTLKSDVDSGESGDELSLWKRQPSFHSRAEMEDIYRSLEKRLEKNGQRNLFGNTVVRNNLAMGLIGSDGGKLSFFDEDVTMEIPPGALEEATIIYCFWPITEADSDRYSRVEDDLAYYAPTIDCGPDGTEFEQYITLKLKHCITEEDRNKAEMLNVFTRGGTNPEWRKDTDGSFEIDGEWAVLKTKHFSEFTVAASTDMMRAAGDKSQCAVDLESIMILSDDISLPIPLVRPVKQLMNYLTSTSPGMPVQPHDTSQLDFHISLGVTMNLLRRHSPNKLLGKVLKGSNYSVSVVGAKGGRLAFLDGSVTMDIPQGALKEPKVIHCWKPGRPTEAGAMSNEGFVTYAPSMTCGPDGTKFDKDVTIRVKHYIPADVPDKTNGLDIFTRNDSQPKWEKDAAGSFQIDGEWVNLTTNHFSAITLGARRRTANLPRRDILVSTAIATHDPQENNLDLHVFFSSSNRNHMHQFIFEERSRLRSNEGEVYELDTANWNNLQQIRNLRLTSAILPRNYVMRPPDSNDVRNIPASVVRALPASPHALQFKMQWNNNNHGLVSDVNITQNTELIARLHVDRTHHHHQQQAS